MSEVVANLTDVSVCYRLAKQRIASFKDYALHWIRGALTYEPLWALRDISFTVHRGEAVAIIGRNGAGKSTLLKVISGVLKPRVGSLFVKGPVAPILELGTGFDYELTGRENIFLNALLQGRKVREIQERYDEIVDFSGLGRFIESPIRNYSSGMVARLGFAIVTSWVPSLLILDEFLAVGDAEFAERCRERIDSLQAAGSTLIMVSHGTDAIQAQSTRCIWLEQGAIVADGPTRPVLDAYLEATRRAAGHHPGIADALPVPAVPTPASDVDPQAIRRVG
jgi:ABC-type polysaccharide/polyol phosphate transport system ATPase subunit